GLTTLGAFGVLLFSRLPGQRELALFATIGITASLLLSLIALPHLVGAGNPSPRGLISGPVKRFPIAPRWIIGSWVVLLALCAWQGTALRFDGDLRALNLVPDEIRAAETKLRHTWGNFRSKALVFAEASDLQSALERNERLLTYLSRHLPPGDVVSLAPIWPSTATQQSNQHRWDQFWSDARVASVRQLLEQESRALGFKAGAFEPFFQRLSAPAPLITAENLQEAGLGELVASLMARSGERVRILTLVPDTAEVAALLDRPAPGLSGIRFVSQQRFRRMISRAIRDDFAGFILKGSLMVCLLLGLLFRNLKKILLALVPVATGIVFMLGGMAGLGMGFNLFNVVAAILVIGLGVDYGIFMVCRLAENLQHGTEQAVLVSGLTTLAGFGALVLARHPALHSIGVTVLLGIGAAIPSALLVIPAIYRTREAGR
ncbi:MAG: MMPL family transporter, partial [Desulfobacterales bacterium]